MDLTTILGLGLVAYYFTQKLNAVKKDIEREKEDNLAWEDNLLTQIEEKNNPKNLAEKYLQITPYFCTRETSGTKWSASFFWVIKNTSSDTTFTIRRIRSQFTMSNGITAAYQPMKQNLNVVVYPGREVKIQMADDIAPWFNTKNDCEQVRKNVLSKCEGKTENYKQLMTVNTQIGVLGNFFANEVVADFANEPGYVWRDTSARTYFGNTYGGENGVNTTW